MTADGMFLAEIGNVPWEDTSHQLKTAGLETERICSIIWSERWRADSKTERARSRLGDARVLKGTPQAKFNARPCDELHLLRVFEITMLIRKCCSRALSHFALQLITRWILVYRMRDRQRRIIQLILQFTPFTLIISQYQIVFELFHMGQNEFHLIPHVWATEVGKLLFKILYFTLYNIHHSNHVSSVKWEQYSHPGTQSEF